jgi:hypothetical protein
LQQSTSPVLKDYTMSSSSLNPYRPLMHIFCSTMLFPRNGGYASLF